ncbi:hypothetical protein [Cohnella hongkongensis]|uniref:DUF1795 domain-containing protein n=1 Tax=Cohnella hongkongensis TaxID=178337 RepID=A0ABV9FN45_9BACL
MLKVCRHSAGFGMMLVLLAILFWESSHAESTTVAAASNSHTAKIGDSYRKWSMNVPVGLRLELNADLATVSFRDAKNTTSLRIDALYAQDPLNAAEQRDILKEYMSDDKIVRQAAVKKSGRVYQILITQSRSGFVFEYRGIQANGYFYVIKYGVKSKSVTALNQSATLIDSFRPAYPSNGQNIKDLARIRDGKINFAVPDYGFELWLPDEWSTELGNPVFFDHHGSRIEVQINKLMPGDSLDKLVDRRMKVYLDSQNIHTYMDPEISIKTWNGVPAKLVKLRYTRDGEAWYGKHEIFAVAGQFKIHIAHRYPSTADEAETQEVLELLLKRFRLHDDLLKKSPVIAPDPWDREKVLTTAVRSSKTYGYRLEVPVKWTTPWDAMEASDVSFEGLGTRFSIRISPEMSMQEYARNLESVYSNFRLAGKWKTELAGRPALKYEYSAEQAPEGKMIVYLLEKDGEIYELTASYDLAYAPKSDVKRLEKVFHSFEFISEAP